MGCCVVYMVGNMIKQILILISFYKNFYLFLYTNHEGRGDVGLKIILAPKVLYTLCYSLAKKLWGLVSVLVACGNGVWRCQHLHNIKYGRSTTISSIHPLRVTPPPGESLCTPLVGTDKKCINFHTNDFGCISIYGPLSHPLRSLV